MDFSKALKISKATKVAIMATVCTISTFAMMTASKNPQEEQREKQYADATYVYATTSTDTSETTPSTHRECPICLEAFENGEEVRWLECCHVFHKACIQEWFKSRSRCAVCMRPCNCAD